MVKATGAITKENVYMCDINYKIFYPDPEVIQHTNDLSSKCTKSYKRYCDRYRSLVQIWLIFVFIFMGGIIVFVLDNAMTLGNMSSREFVVGCYYNMPTSGGAARQLQPQGIHPHLCTHINIAFASIFDNRVYLEDYQYRSITDIVKLKEFNPKLKILLSIGGGGGDHGFSEMVLNHASRKIFIKSIKNVLRNYTLDGIDLDWEFPAVHGPMKQYGGRERQHFSQLLREIRAEYIRENRNYLLTVAVAAPEPIVDAAYDVNQLNMYADFVNVMTYDYHFFTKYTPFTGLNSPLYARPDEQLYMASLNVNYTVHMYKSKGLDSGKILVGIPTYGHTFSLVNEHNNKIRAPASGFGLLGSSGFVNYPDVCMFKKNYSTQVTEVHDDITKVPYLYRNHEWVSFEDTQSVTNKATFIIEQQLAGGMIYSLNADDYDGLCGIEIGHKNCFPLTLSISNTLKNLSTTTAEST